MQFRTYLSHIPSETVQFQQYFTKLYTGKGQEQGQQAGAWAADRRRSRGSRQGQQTGAADRSSGQEQQSLVIYHLTFTSSHFLESAQQDLDSTVALR
jgi:hypothetical protein